MKISDLLKIFNEGDQTQTESVEKVASTEIDLEEMLEKLVDEAFEKAAAAPAPEDTEEPESPEEMLDNSGENLSEEDILAIANAASEMGEAAENAANQAKETIKNNIIQAGAAVVQDALRELTESQQIKVAYVAKHFENPSKAKLFAKLAAKQLAGQYRIVQDMNFSAYFTLDGNPKPQGDEGAEKVNKI